MSMSSSSPSLPPSVEPRGGGTVVTLSSRASERVRRGQVLIPRTEVVVPAASGAELVLLRDERGRPLGSALWASEGPVAARLWDPAGSLQLEPLLEARLEAALVRRQLLLGERRDAYRLVHGEADLLPGLFVDRYADALVLQTATAVMDRRKARIAELLGKRLRSRLLVLRDDGSARDLEGLPREKGVLVGGSSAVVRFHDAGSLMEADLLADRKTGSFLDQQDNHALAGEYAARMVALHGRGQRGLDGFAYHGGFGLALARAGLSVLCCDEDAQAVQRTRRNAELNRVTVDAQVGNVFDLVRRLEAERARFAVISLDPPALAKRAGRGPLDSAVRAYRELFLRGLRLLAPGGLLFASSCSGRVSAELFGQILATAAEGAQRPVQLLERRGAGRDHPVLLSLRETEYLKCFVLQAVE